MDCFISRFQIRVKGLPLRASALEDEGGQFWYEKSRDSVETNFRCINESDNYFRQKITLGSPSVVKWPIKEQIHEHELIIYIWFGIQSFRTWRQYIRISTIHALHHVFFTVSWFPYPNISRILGNNEEFHTGCRTQYKSSKYTNYTWIYIYNIGGKDTEIQWNIERIQSEDFFDEFFRCIRY